MDRIPNTEYHYLVLTIRTNTEQYYLVNVELLEAVADLGDGDEAGGVEVAAMEEVELSEKREGAEEGAEGEGWATLTNEKLLLSVLTNQSPALPGTQWSPPSHVGHPHHHY